MFDVMLHADWSVDPRKRWAAIARRGAHGWEVEAPTQMASATRLLDDAFHDAASVSWLLGFDFPIGLPAAYGTMTGFAGFRHALPVFGTGAWNRFFDVAEHADDVSLRRPFYPRVPRKGVSPSELVSALGVPDFDALYRISERRTEYRRAACSLFWTLGGNQVGKAALAGWKEIVCPGLQRGARLWPFDGTLEQLSGPGVVIAETYPAESYRLVGAEFRPGQSKRRRTDRATKADPILSWCSDHGIRLTPPVIAIVQDGCGDTRFGEDQFDALLGLLKMIEVAEGRQPEATLDPDRQWEGWILGR